MMVTLYNETVSETTTGGPGTVGEMCLGSGDDRLPYEYR